MAEIDIKQILVDCLTEAKNQLGKSWKSFAPYAEHEFKQFAENAEFLAKLKLLNEIDDNEFKARIEMQRLALNNVLLTIKGIGLVTAQNLVNAVINIVSGAIQKVIQVALPI